MKNYLHIFLLIGALFSASILSAQQPAAPLPTAMSESLYTSRDSMTYYASLCEQGDARGQFVMAVSYYYALGRTVPNDVPRIHTRREALSLLRRSSEQGYEPAANLLKCMEKYCSPEELGPGIKRCSEDTPAPKK